MKMKIKGLKKLFRGQDNILSTQEYISLKKEEENGATPLEFGEVRKKPGNHMKGDGRTLLSGGLNFLQRSSGWYLKWYKTLRYTIMIVVKLNDAIALLKSKNSWLGLKPFSGIFKNLFGQYLIFDGG
jgi:hypothetical protein